ncbi:hypothetical protein EV361DRAFT_779654, partial [Lentinula raphanica]
VYVSSTSLEVNTRIIKNIWERTIAPWATRVGFEYDYEKRELAHYTRRRSDNSSSPSITFIDRDGVTRTVKPQQIVKWLGVYLDRKLTFNHHVKTLAGNAGKALGALTMLANTVKGMSQYHLRLMYKSCVVPVMTYASPVWWTGKKVHEKAMEKIQNR